MKEIPLTQGHVALVDDEDYERISAYGKWHIFTSYKSLVAAHTMSSNGIRGKTVFIHRIVLNNPNGMIRTADGNYLNCQRSNLRVIPRGISQTREYANAASRKMSAVQKHRNYLKYHYRLSADDYQKAVDEQSGMCKVCGDPPDTVNLCVDHDHACCPTPRSCGKCIRSLLCRRCNSLLGMANDNIELFRSLISYLEYWKDKRNYEQCAVPS